MAELIEEARKDNVTEVAGMKKQELIFNILKERVKMNGLMYGEGTLEILPDGFGFLAQSRLSLPLLPRRYLRLAQPDSPLRTEDRRHRLGTDSPSQRKRTLLCPAARRSDQLSGSQPRGDSEFASTI